MAIFNQKYFLLFLLYTTACTIYAGTLLVARFISCTNNLKQCTVSGIPAVLCVLCFIEAIIFGLFCLVMMYDQLSAIFENTPGIDALQNKKGEARGRYASLCEVFGEPLNWRWWFPLTLPSSLESSFRTELEEMDDPEEQEELREMRLQRQYERQALLAQRQAERERNLAASGAAGSSSSPTTNSSSSTSNSRGESIADGHHRQSLQGPIVFPDGMNQRMKDKAAAVLGREQPIATGTTTPKQEADQQESKEPAAKKQQ